MCVLRGRKCDGKLLLRSRRGHLEDVRRSHRLNRLLMNDIQDDGELNGAPVRQATDEE